MPKRRKKSIKQKRKNCRDQGLVTKNCRKSRRGRKRGSRSRRRSRRRKSIKQLRAECRKQGLVYDVKTKRCRSRRKRERKRGSRNRRKQRFRSWFRKPKNEQVELGEIVSTPVTPEDFVKAASYLNYSKAQLELAKQALKAKGKKELTPDERKNLETMTRQNIYDSMEALKEAKKAIPVQVY